MRNVLIVAPHPDDETLGCGGTIFRHLQAGDHVHWLIVTTMTPEMGYSNERILRRQEEIQTVAACYGFHSVKQLAFPAARLDTVAASDLVGEIAGVIHLIQPEIVYAPYPGDVHTDHRMVFDAVASCTKWFRYPSVSRVLVYETLSETDFGIHPDRNGFSPNVFVDISAYLEQKIEILNQFESEVAAFPFPRSETAVRALAQVRGAASGYPAAEAFMILRERW